MSETASCESEREALDQIVREYDGWWPETRDAILAAGFRRPVQGEPTTEDAWLAGERSVADALHFAANPEPQGEPTDAQVHALTVLEEVEPVAEVFGNSTAFGRSVIALRRLVDEAAALRAATAVTEQGENRG